MRIFNFCNISRRLVHASTTDQYKRIVKDKGQIAAKQASIENMVRLDKCWRETYGWGAERFAPVVRIEWGKPLTWVLNYIESLNSI
eukprot:8591568-Karenia_brevis.AAC.1